MEFGDDEPADDEPSSRTVLRALLADPRLVLVCAGLAGIAVFGSMMGEWFTVQVSNRGDPADTTLYEWRMGVGGAGSPGAAYLVGVLLLAILVMLALGGPASTRRAARVAGLGAAGAVLAVLIAFRATPDFLPPGIFFSPEDERTILFGRGLTIAFLVPILAGLAFVLAARAARYDVTAVEVEGPVEVVERPTVVDWAWRRPRQSATDRARDLSEPPPLDLTVKPATPFAHPDPSTER